MDAGARLLALSRLPTAAEPVVSVYLDTRWTDEHQRDRTRAFVRDESRRARAAASGTLAADLDWIEEQTSMLVAQTRQSAPHGVALFACGAIGLRELVEVDAALDPCFVVDARPYVRPLADAVAATPAALVVFVDAERARLIPLGDDTEEVVLTDEVEGHHRRGGWALLAQSRYRRRLEQQRTRHFDAVADALGHIAERGGAERIVLAGPTEAVAGFLGRLPQPLAAHVAGTVSGAAWEPARLIAGRAAEVLRHAAQGDAALAVEHVLTEAAKGGRAVAGLAPTLDAVMRGSVRRLFLLKTFRERGATCDHCGALAGTPVTSCPMCGRPPRPVELGEAMVERVTAAGGAVETLADNAALARQGGVAALLRYPL